LNSCQQLPCQYAGDLFGTQEKVVDANNFLWFGLVMVGLKSFLYGLGPLLGTTGIALYERQRILISLGVVTAVPGRGPGSGAPLTADNIAAMIISVLAADAPSEIDREVADLCNAIPEPAARNDRHWRAVGKPTFQTELGRALTGKSMVWREEKGPPYCVRVSRRWRGQIVTSPSGAMPLNFIPQYNVRHRPHRAPINMTAEIEGDTLEHLLTFTLGALSQVGTEEDKE
jgi:hypothetical protein